MFFQQRMTSFQLWGTTWTIDMPECWVQGRGFFHCKDVGDTCTADICEQVEGLSAWLGIGVEDNDMSSLL
jgi:hypothetical protein